MIPINLASRFFPGPEVFWEQGLGMYFVKNHCCKAMGVGILKGRVIEVVLAARISNWVVYSSADMPDVILRL